MSSGSEFFDPAKNNSNLGSLLSPDYSPSEEDLDESIEPDDDSILQEHIEESVKESYKAEQKGSNMSIPFGTPPSVPTPNFTPSWGSSGSSSWGSGSSNNGNVNVYGFSGQNRPGYSGSSFGGGTTKEALNRNKKVIFINFMDCVVETLQSNGGSNLFLQPRGIYDFKPRLEVWAKLKAYGKPDRIYLIVPVNLIPITNGDWYEGWQNLLSYYCCSLSSFLEIPYTNCQVLALTQVGQPSSDAILSIIDDPKFPIDRKSVVMIGLLSGTNGLSNDDSRSAEVCNIDYIDLNYFLNFMY